MSASDEMPSNPDDTSSRPTLTPEKERRLEIFGGLTALVLAVFTFVLQIRDRYSKAWSGTALALSIAAGLLFFAVWWGVSRLRARVRLTAAATALLMALSAAVILATAPRSRPAAPAAPSVKVSVSPTIVAIVPSSTATPIATLLRVPDQSDACGGGIVLASGSDPTSPAIGDYALTANTQVSVLLQSTETYDTVITGVSTVVDGVTQPIRGHSYRLADCQGVPGKEYYVADLSKPRTPVTPNPRHPKTDEFPITISGTDPVVVYVMTTSVAQPTEWHLEIHYVISGKEGTLPVFDRGHSIVSEPDTP